MLDRLRELARVENLKRSARTKLLNVVDEVVGKHRRAQSEEIAHLRSQVEELRHRADRTLDRVVEFEVRTRRDMFYAGEREAAADSHAFANDHMADARTFEHPHQTLEYALSLAPTGGLALEFGVYSGTTLKIIATHREGGSVYGFDSFDGLPESWRPGFPAGAFDTDQIPDVPGAELVVGLFDDTLPGFLEEHPGPVDFLHIDADLYSSTKTVLTQVGPRLRPGSIVVFDEFFNYPGWREHEFRAWEEYVAASGVKSEFAAYTYCSEQVAVRITSV